jgi:periplasmic copper chaperone A
LRNRSSPTTEAVSEIDWKADSASAYLAPQEFGEFTIIAGQLPDAPSLTFKAIQTYSDGTVVSWTDVEAPGSTADLDHPAPVLTLPKAAASTGGGSSDTGAVILSIVALVIAAAAAGYAFVSRATQRSGP